MSPAVLNQFLLDVRPGSRLAAGTPSSAAARRTSPRSPGLTARSGFLTGEDVCTVH
jgi:hypothetical protein